MIRINLLGQARPKGKRAAVAPGAGLQLVLLAVILVFAGGIIFLDWRRINNSIQEVDRQINDKRAEKAQLELLKRRVEEFERQKALLEQRIAVIEELKRNKTGGQELLEKIAATVTRTEALWLTSLTRKGNALVMEGTSRSMNEVANFITQLKRIGYFDKIEIKEARQDERLKELQTFLFTLTAEVSTPPPATPPAPPPAAPATKRS